MTEARGSAPAFPVPPSGVRGWPWTAELPDRAAGEAAGSPKISLITPSFNQGAFIERMIRSVLLQGYPDVELIVVDGGSTDGTVEILKKYSPFLAHWESVSDRGQSHAINKGLSRCTGEIVNWLNSDDVLMPGALAGVAALYRKNPRAVAWAGACRRVDEDGRLVVVYRPKGLTRDGLAD